MWKYVFIGLVFVYLMPQITILAVSAISYTVAGIAAFIWVVIGLVWLYTDDSEV